MKFETVTVDDAAELLSIYAGYVTDTAISFEYEVPSLAEFTQRIVNIRKKYPYIKAVDDSGAILGYAYASTFKGRSAYDWSVESTIYLRQDVHGRGIGRALYTELENQLREQGILNMNACIALAGENDPYLTNASYFFHTSMGFSPVGTFHKSGFKFNRWYDMIWMEKMLGDHTDRPKNPFSSTSI